MVLILDSYYNSRLGMEAVITATGDFPIERFAREKGIIIPAVLTVGKNRESFLYYFEDIEEQSRDTSLFLRANNARKNGNVLTLYSNSTHYKEYNFFRNLTAVPSLVLDFQYVMDGSHYFHLRFHRKYLNEFSNLISSESFPAINSIRYVGENRKSVEKAKILFDLFKVMHISYRFMPPEMPGRESNIRRIEGDLAGELRHISEYKKILFNLYVKPSDSAIPGDMAGQISSDEITEVPFENEMLNEIIFLSEHVAFPNFGIYFTRKNGILRFEALIPAMYAREYMKKVFSVSSRLPEWGIVLDNVSEASFE